MDDPLRDMSDDDDGASRSSVARSNLSIHLGDINVTLLHNPGLPCINKPWLDIPDQFMKPKTMCAVNQFVHIVSELDTPYLSTSCELVLFGTGTSFPEHFRWMVYCMEMVSELFY